MTGSPDPSVLNDLRRRIANAGMRLSARLQAVGEDSAGLLDALGRTPLGAVATFYSDSAFQGWSLRLDRDPDDCEARHHLAIMHHARAIDLEQGNVPSQSDADWEAALGHWCVLCECDRFWHKLQRYLPQTSASRLAEELRGRWPAALLQLHVDIAFDPDTPLHRRRFHVRMVRGSPFSGAVKEQALDAAYERELRGVPAAIWSEDAHDTDQLQTGLDAIERYLDFDPESLPALSDAIRLQSRWLTRWMAELIAMSHSSGATRDASCEQLIRLGDAWRPRFDRLVSRPNELDLNVRSRLSDWYRIRGGAAFLLGRLQLAEQCHSVAAELAQGLEQQRLCQEELLQSRAEIAWEKAHQSHRDALESCRALADAAAGHPGSAYRLAEALEMLDDYDLALEVAQRGARLATASGADERFSRLLIRLQNARTQLKPVLQRFGALEVWHEVRKARIAVHERRRADAVQRLRGAFQRNPDNDALRSELALTLSNLALALFEERADRVLDETEQEQIRDWLTEALELAPRDEALIATWDYVSRHFC